MESAQAALHPRRARQIREARQFSPPRCGDGHASLERCRWREGPGAGIHRKKLHRFLFVLRPAEDIAIGFRLYVLGPGVLTILAVVFLRKQSEAHKNLDEDRSHELSRELRKFDAWRTTLRAAESTFEHVIRFVPLVDEFDRLLKVVHIDSDFFRGR